jgi:cobalt-precorrin-5B (C1)-methyltransferase
MQTHVSEGGVDFDFLTELVEQLGVDEPLLARIGQANTARHVQMLLREAGVAGLEERLAQLAAERACAWVDGAFDVEVLLFDIGGDLLAIGTKEGTR